MNSSLQMLHTLELQAVTEMVKAGSKYTLLYTPKRGINPDPLLITWALHKAAADNEQFYAELKKNLLPYYAEC
jgi:hypothetical protein